MRRGFGSVPRAAPYAPTINTTVGALLAAPSLSGKASPAPT